MLIFNIQLPLIWLCACFFPVNILKSGHFRLEGVGGDQHVVGVSLVPFTSALHFLQRGLQHERTQTNSEIARDTRNYYRFKGLYTCIFKAEVTSLSQCWSSASILHTAGKITREKWFSIFRFLSCIYACKTTANEVCSNYGHLEC